MNYRRILAGAATIAVGAGMIRRARKLDLNGRLVLITGGSRGLGLELAREFARQGARLVLLARSEEDLLRAANSLGDAAVSVQACDLREPAEVEDAVRRVVARFGPLDVLVNDAGTIRVGPVSDLGAAAFRDEMESNFFTALNVTLAALPHLQRRGEGRIINITSIGGRLPVPHLLPYTASKFALFGFSQALASELRREGIRVTTVVPGLMRTGSPYRARFGGQREQEFRWFLLLSSLPILSVSARHAARSIVSAGRRGDETLILPAWIRLPIALEGLSPGTVTRLSALANRLLPTAAGRHGQALREGRHVLPPEESPGYSLLTRRAARRNFELD